MNEWVNERIRPGGLISNTLNLGHWDFPQYWAHMLVQVAIYRIGFWLVDITISTDPKPTIYRNLYENTGPESLLVNVYRTSEPVRDTRVALTTTPGP